MMKLTVTALFPDMLGLYGDRGNLMALAHVAEKLGAELVIDRISDFRSPIELANTDLLCCGACETRVAIEAANALLGCADAIGRFVEDGGAVFCSGGSSAIFGKGISRRNGDEAQGLGIIDASYTELRAVYSNDAVFETDAFGEAMQIVGGQLQMLKVFVGDGAQPLGRCTYGYGNRKESDEGIRYKNFYATNLLGPVLVKNPWLAAALLGVAAKNAGGELPDTADWSFERGANEKIKAFISMKINSGSDKTRLNNEEVYVDV